MYPINRRFFSRVASRFYLNASSLSLSFVLRAVKRLSRAHREDDDGDVPDDAISLIWLGEGDVLGDIISLMGLGELVGCPMLFSVPEGDDGDVPGDIISLI